MHGRVLGLTDIDKRGDALTTAVASGDTVLFVGDTSDFEEDTSDGTYWLTIADTTPRQYLAVDHDANTVTLAAAAGATFEIDDPVDVWDPSVPPAGAKVAEYLVDVMTDRGPVPAVVDHETAGFAGEDHLVGASVSLPEEERADGSVHVDRIFGRVPLLDQGVIDTPFLLLSRGADVSWADTGTTFAPFTTWVVDAQANMSQTAGVVDMEQPGLCVLVLTVRWAGNSSGRRVIRLVSTIGGVDTEMQAIPASPPDASPYTQQVVALHNRVVGETFRAEARQTSGAALDVLAVGTSLQIVRVQA